ncbi:MAG: rod shape-determining protein RodA [Candidatus Staskawiczbacteria bacterium]|jgi:rod shape determining protein RodA
MMLLGLSVGPINNHLKRLDWWLIGSAIVLTVFGLLAVYSASLRGGDLFNFQKQIIFFVIGFALMLFISFFDYRILKNNSYLILVLYFFALLLLAGVFILAPEIRGKRGWYKIGAFSFDPIEPLKIILIILLAKYFSMRHAEMYKPRHIIFSGIYVFLPALLIFFQPDAGAVLILLIVWVSILFISGIKMRHLLILSLCAILLLMFSWQFLLKDYQRQRVLDFAFPRDPFGGSWSQSQAAIAIGSGEIFGRGFTNGSQTQYGFLPEPHTDFAFSVIAEEFGLVGVSAVFACYFILIWRIIKIAIHSRSNFPRLFASGFTIVLIAQFFINVGMNVGVMPVIGIYLPLISYGGSGLVGTFVGLGILQSIKAKS